MNSTSLAELGFDEVNVGKLFTTQTEVQKCKHTTLKVEPQCDEPATTSPKRNDINNGQQGGSNTEFFGEAFDLNNNDDDINIAFSSQTSERSIVIVRTNQTDIIEMLVKENRKTWGIIRQWETKYKHLEKSWELRARVIADLEEKLFNQSGPSNMNTEIKNCMEQKDAKI
ncbi:hypothetical protein CsSME_00003081 [Camellia sinensis var. sinensis]